MNAIAAMKTTQHDVQASLTYYTRVSGKAVVYQGAPGKESERPGEFDHQSVRIADARPIARELRLDTHGFESHVRPTRVKDFYDERQVTDVYYPEVRELLTDVTGASKVVIFDHTIRVEDVGKREALETRAPVQMVHNDYTERSGPQRVLDLIDENEANEWLRNRFAVINVWRSIGEIAQTQPLALADARSVSSDDLVLTDLVYPDRVGEIYYVAHNPEHRWYYISDSRRDEAILIKSYDSAQDGRARFTPHTAFQHPHPPANAAARESIEVRALVLFN